MMAQLVELNTKVEGPNLPTNGTGRRFQRKK